MILKIALVFNFENEGTTGNYFKKILEKTKHKVDHYWTKDAENIPKEYDLYLRIDHGDYKYDLPDDLHPRVFYAIDTHLKKPFKKIVNQARGYDLVFCAQYSGVSALRFRRIKARWLPLACEPKVHKKLDIPKTYDIGFVGTDGKKSLRKVLLNELSKKYPNSFLSTASFSRMGRIYSASKIGFNYSIKNDINMRMFEILSSGTLLMTNEIKNNGFDELFKDGRHLVIYKNKGHLLKLAEYYLTHDKEREEIATRGYQLMRKQHTYQARVVRMFEYIKTDLGGTYSRLRNL